MALPVCHLRRKWLHSLRELGKALKPPHRLQTSAEVRYRVQAVSFRALQSGIEPGPCRSRRALKTEPAAMVCVAWPKDWRRLVSDFLQVMCWQ